MTVGAEARTGRGAAKVRGGRRRRCCGQGRGRGEKTVRWGLKQPQRAQRFALGLWTQFAFAVERAAPPPRSTSASALLHSTLLVLMFAALRRRTWSSNEGCSAQRMGGGEGPQWRGRRRGGGGEGAIGVRTASTADDRLRLWQLVLACSLAALARLPAMALVRTAPAWPRSRNGTFVGVSTHFRGTYLLHGVAAGGGGEASRRYLQRKAEIELHSRTTK
eukprot:4861789-Pleurochrysis_carterae.AAC.2